MGCDIHLFVEANIDLGNGRHWRSIQRQIAFSDWRETRTVTLSWYPGRNYDEFAILADVRNGRGFAGIDTGDAFAPLALPKGLPDDVSEDVEEESRRYGDDGHSHSWLTLPELVATDGYWDQRVKKRGVVTKAQARAYQAHGVAPEEWCGDITPFPHKTHERLEWEISYRDHAGYLLNDLVPSLRRLLNWDALSAIHRARDRGERLTEDDLRIVFFFDN